MSLNESALEGYTKKYDERFELIKEQYNKPYEWPEMDTLRYEICGCISFGCNQAAITLTNHLLESLLKYSLSYRYSINNLTPPDKEYEVIELLMKYSEKGFKKYGKKTLNSNLIEAKKVGLINEEEYNKLQYFRSKFRNPFGHSDKEKIFDGLVQPVSGAKFEGATIIERTPVNIEVARMPVLHGLVQAQIAELQAPLYFKEMDKIVRVVKNRVFPESEKTA